jgi:hypothetical protein
MKFSFRNISFLFLFAGMFLGLESVKAYGGKDWNQDHDGIEIPARFKMNYGVGLGFGVRTTGMFLETSAVLFNRVSIGGTIGVRGYNYRLYSSSDLHEIRMRYFPYMAKASVIVYKGASFKLFLYGRYGQVWKQNRRGVTHDKPNETISWEAGAGVAFDSQIPVQLFIGQTYTRAKGNLESTYESSIDFDFDMYNFYLGASISLFSNR